MKEKRIDCVFLDLVGRGRRGVALGVVLVRDGRGEAHAVVVGDLRREGEKRVRESQS